ncbi:MAG: hypothetical protein AAGH15_10165 [Myxococcota bacterium]
MSESDRFPRARSSSDETVRAVAQAPVPPGPEPTPTVPPPPRTPSYATMEAGRADVGRIEAFRLAVERQVSRWPAPVRVLVAALAFAGLATLTYWLARP